MEGSSKDARSRADTTTKPRPGRHRADSDNNTRNRIRNALPSLHHGQPEHDQSRHNAQKPPQSHRQAVKETVQSALELRPPINFDHILRRDKKAPAPSRRSTGNNANKDDDGISKPQQQTRILSKKVGVEEVNKVRQENQQREEELRNALQQVEEQSMQSTRELDNTYYILLEKAESLRQIVSSMQRLAEESRTLRDNFQTKSQALEQDTDATLSSYNNFMRQEKDIKQMLSRLENYKKRTTALNGRLDTARHRVESCEQRIVNAQTQRKKRWNITWATTISLIIVLFAIAIARDHSVLETANNITVRATDRPADFTSPVLTRLKSRTDKDPYLHDLFDGLS